MPAIWEKFCFFRELASEGPWDTGELAAAGLAQELRRSFMGATGLRSPRALAEAADRGAPVTFFDERLRISYVVDVSQFSLRSVAMTDMHRSLRLPHQRFGPVGITFHAWERFRERYPKAARASESFPVEKLVRAMRESFARVRHEVLDVSTTEIRRVTHPSAGEVRYYRDRSLDLRYVVAEDKKLLLTVEIPKAWTERAHAIPPSWKNEE